MASHLYGWSFRLKPLLTGGSGRILPHVGQSSKRREAESIKIKGFWAVRPDAHPMKRNSGKDRAGKPWTTTLFANQGLFPLPVNVAFCYS
jgi:hypothetical protein